MTGRAGFSIKESMARFSGACWKCGAAWEGASQPGRSDVCPRCGFDLRCCKNCEFHDPRYHNECRIPDTELIKDRERSNFCDQFKFAPLGVARKKAEAGDDPRKRLDRLFGG